MTIQSKLITIRRKKQLAEKKRISAAKAEARTRRAADKSAK